MREEGGGEDVMASLLTIISVHSTTSLVTACFRAACDRHEHEL